MNDFLFGRVDRPEQRRQVHRELGLLPLSIAAPHLFGAPPPADMLLYRAWKTVLGKYPAYPAQQIGDCTSFGLGHGHDLLQCILAAVLGLEYFETCTEAIYGGGREIGGMLGGQDGCDGSFVLKAAMQIGLCTRKDVGEYSGARARQWGRTGLPADVKALCGKVKLGGGALVTTAEEADAALANGNPITIASNCGFQGGGGFRRDARGICRVGGTWPHQMHICGRISSDGVDTYVIGQSWGDEQPSGPVVLDMPDYTFRALKEDVVRYIFSAGDSYAISDTPGFARRALPPHWTMGAFA